MKRLIPLKGLAALLLATATAAATAKAETPMLAPLVLDGSLPPLAERLPRQPLVVFFDNEGGDGASIGRHGGRLRMLMAKTKDIRQLTVYGYARLVGYNPGLELEPDILERVENLDNRVFTLHLRLGHRWSDGAPFTTGDFRYWWEDIANNPELSPSGPPRAMLVKGLPPKFTVLDRQRVRFEWLNPNPFFLPALAAPRPLYIYRPAHYLRQFHRKYADRRKLSRLIEDERLRNWQALHFKRDRPYRASNPELPNLQPWVNTTAPPATRFLFVRNPYYHRIDSRGQQLPYIDEIVVNIVSGSLIPAKTGAGESDLQARYLRFDNYTFLKEGEKRNPYRVLLWRNGRGNHMTLYPNLNTGDREWRRLLRQPRFRQALSLAINRREINQVIYFGLATESNNCLLPESPLHRAGDCSAWAGFDIHQANYMLDRLGLDRGGDGIRTLPDGRPLELVVQTAGESSEQSDVLELIGDSWRQIGVRLLISPSVREVFRRRIFSGEALMSVWFGLENGLMSAEQPPDPLVPSSRYQYQWPAWGTWFESGGKAGERPQDPAARQLAGLGQLWRLAAERSERERIWMRILDIHRDQLYTIGTVSQTLQPIVVHRDLRNVPRQALYNFEPGAYFGIYRPDAFWFSSSP